MASSAEREADASREEGADEGRAFDIADVSVAPAWPITEAMIISSLLSFVSVAAAAAGSKAAASGTIFTTIV